MKKYIILSCAFFFLITTTVFGQEQKMKRQKLAQTGMKFLSVSTDARISALGDAGTALEGNSALMFYNPAGLGFLNGFADVSMGQVDWIADIKYIHGGAVFSPVNGVYGVFGISFLSADYGEFNGTIRYDNDQGFINLGNLSPSPSALAIGISYAKALSNQFSVGGNIKYVNQDLGSNIVGFNGEAGYKEEDYSEDVYAFDFGILYRTGFKSLNFGMCIRNFSEEVTYEDESFQLPLIFKIGVAMDILDLYGTVSQKTHALLVSVDAVHPRDYYEQVNFGLEYLFLKTFALRLGYSTPNDEHGVSAGVGLQQAYRDYMIALDYAYTPFGVFNDVHRVSVHFSL
ncbi:MAG: PorV/PorQ family protein [bacterium]|nr:MAG: PorV/PorQ family protein [bacterium]